MQPCQVDKGVAHQHRVFGTVHAQGRLAHISAMLWSSAQQNEGPCGRLVRSICSIV